MKKTFILIICLLVTGIMSANPPKAIKIGLLKYQGGGDWYSLVDAIKNLAEFCNKEMHTCIDPDYAIVEAGNPDIHNYPFVFMTGHGNVVFNNQESENLRSYLIGGGFLYIDDDYGMDKFIRPSLRKLFPESELIELPFNHPIYHQKFDFPQGIPKIHEHDEKTPQAFGIFYEGRLVCLYTYESNISDGWESSDVHKDPEEVRQKALKMGANIIRYVFTE